MADLVVVVVGRLTIFVVATAAYRARAREEEEDHDSDTGSRPAEVNREY